MIQLGCILEDYSDLAEMQWCIQYCSRKVSVEWFQVNKKLMYQACRQGTAKESVCRDTDKWFSILLRDQGIILIPNFTFFAWTFSIHEQLSIG